MIAHDSRWPKAFLLDDIVVHCDNDDGTEVQDPAEAGACCWIVTQDGAPDDPYAPKEVFGS